MPKATALCATRAPTFSVQGKPLRGSQLPPRPAGTSFPQETGKGDWGATTLAAARALAACSLLSQRVSPGASPLTTGPRATEPCAVALGVQPGTQPQQRQPSNPGQGAEQAFPPQGLVAAPRFSCSRSGTWSGNHCPNGKGTRDSPEKPWAHDVIWDRTAGPRPSCGHGGRSCAVALRSRQQPTATPRGAPSPTPWTPDPQVPWSPASPSLSYHPTASPTPKAPSPASI